MFFSFLASLLFPEKCVLCRKILQKGEVDLCHRCRIDSPECPISKIKYPFLDKWTALWYYEGNVRGSLLRYKFSGRRAYAASYGRMLAMKLLRENRIDVDIITWIPISDKRKRKRGFDQVELLAEKMSEELSIPVIPLLRKLRDNPPQSGITGEAQRRANVLGVYEAIHTNEIIGKRILLLDDILTTGATAGEAARVLLTAGAERVDLAAVAAAGPKKHKQ